MKQRIRATNFGRRLARGVTLVELVISITVVSIASAAVLGVMTLTTRGSADAMVRYQQVAIGNAYLEEILLKSYRDPDVGCLDGAESRANFDDIRDYHNLSDLNGATDQFGVLVPGLQAYDVTVAIDDVTLGNPSNIPARRATVTVSHPAGVPMTFSGYRTDPGIPCAT